MSYLLIQEKKGWKRRPTLWNWLITKTRLCIRVIDVQFHIFVVLYTGVHCFVLLLCDLCSMHCNGFYTLAYLWCEVMGRISKQNQAPNILRSNVLNEKFKIQFFLSQRFKWENGAVNLVVIGFCSAGLMYGRSHSLLLRPIESLNSYHFLKFHFLLSLFAFNF